MFVEGLKAGNIRCRTSQSTTQAMRSVLKTDPSTLNPPEQSLRFLVQSAKSQPLPTPNLTQALGATYILGDFGYAQYLEVQTTPFISPARGTPMGIWLSPTLFSRVHPTIRPDHFHVAQMIKCVEEKFPVDVVKEYEEAPTSTWKLMEFYRRGSMLWLVTTMSLSMIWILLNNAYV